MSTVRRCSEAKKHPISGMCSYFEYSRAAYYKSLKKHIRTTFCETVIADMVRAERCVQPRLGGRKLYHILGNDIRLVALHVGRDKFFSLLRRTGLLVERKRSYTKTTRSWHHFHKYDNLLRDISDVRPDQVWASDITYIRTEKKFVYLSLITDMYSRRIVGWSLSESLSIEGCLSALKKALKQSSNRRPQMHHSDRGVQYCSNEYVQVLKKNKIAISMTEDRHCYENALAERVNGILKDEYLLDGTFKNFSHAEKSCREAIRLYNTRRPHHALKFKTPEQVYHAA